MPAARTTLRRVARRRLDRGRAARRRRSAERARPRAADGAPGVARPARALRRGDGAVATAPRRVNGNAVWLAQLTRIEVQAARVRARWEVEHEALERMISLARSGRAVPVIGLALAEAVFGSWLAGEDELFETYRKELMLLVERNEIPALLRFALASDGREPRIGRSDAPLWDARAFLLAAAGAHDGAAPRASRKPRSTPADVAGEPLTRILVRVCAAEKLGFVARATARSARAERVDRRLAAARRGRRARRPRRGARDVRAAGQPPAPPQVDRRTEGRRAAGRFARRRHALARRGADRRLGRRAGADRRARRSKSQAGRPRAARRPRRGPICTTSPPTTRSRCACIARASSSPIPARRRHARRLHARAGDRGRPARARSARSSASGAMPTPTNRGSRRCSSGWRAGGRRSSPTGSGSSRSNASSKSATHEVGAFIAAQALRHGDHVRALAIAQMLTKLDPLDEGARRVAIRAHLAANDRGAAILEYRSYRALLHDELDVEPSSDLKQLLEAS